ncbi:Putative F-box protein At1g50870 [Linum perenne]
MRLLSSHRTTTDDADVAVNNGILIAECEDLFFQQILARLPVKSLMRFKSVSKAWKSVIEQDPHFINSHRAHSESRPGLLISCYLYSARKFREYALSDLKGDGDGGSIVKLAWNFISSLSSFSLCYEIAFMFLFTH